MADEIIEIVDGDEDAATKRVRFDARRWYLSKLAPKRYGERQHLDHTLMQQEAPYKDAEEYSDEELIRIIRSGQ